MEDQYGCNGYDTLRVTVTLSSGIGDTFETILRVYPNPVIDFITIDWEGVAAVVSVSVDGRGGLYYPTGISIRRSA
ncbi:MAG: hypothetical protein R2744_09170 [Bacteroidales bacterium]